MFSRFGGLTWKIVRLARITHTTNSHSVSAIIFSQKSNYATAAPSTNFAKTRSLEFIIRALKERIENKSRLTKNDLQSLLTKLKTQKVDSAQALEILRCCSYARTDDNKSTLVNNIWEELKKQNNQFQIQHYNCMLQLASDKADAKRVQEIFDEMVKADIKPNAVSYQCLLGTYCKSGNIDKAIDVLGMMDKDNLYINERSYNSLVQCHIICGNLEAAKETIANLKEAGFKLNYYTLDAILSHHAKAGDLENIEKTLELFNEENVELLGRDILNVMCDLAVNGHAEKIDALLPHLKPTMEMRRSLQSAITLFVEKRQSPIVPKVLQLADGDVKGKVKHLIEEMVRFSTPEPEFNETIANIEAMGITLEENFDLFKPALESSSEEFIRKLLTHMKSRSIEVSESVFEKLFQLAAKKGEKEVLDIVSLMCSEFKTQPQISFVRDVILPGLNVKENPALAFAKLQGTKLRARNTVLAIVNSNLNNGDIKTAYDFVISNSKQSFYGIGLVTRPLLKAFATTGDVSHFVSFVRLIHDSFLNFNSYYQDKKCNESEIKEKQKGFVDEILYSAVLNRRSDTQLITQLLNSFIQEGLAISPSQAEKIQKYLEVDGETQIGRLLKKLSTDALKLRPVEVKRGMPSVMNQLSSTEVQKFLEVKQSLGHSSAATEKLLFLAYIREGNIAEIETLMADRPIALSNSDYALLTELHTNLGNLENALNMLKRACANSSTFKLDCMKVARLVTLMVEKERDFGEIEALLQAHRPPKTEFRILAFERLLDRLANNGNMKWVEKLFHALLTYSYVEPTVELTGPLVLCHLKNGAHTEAVAMYEELAQKYNFVPMTMLLFVDLIQHNEIELLQRAFDTFEKKIGENTALCRLAFAFVECGKERQARTIFEKDGTKNLSRYITRECKQYVTYGRIDAAKTLLKTTQGLYCDRHVIYQTLLDIYGKEKKAQEALDLWYEYSTEDGILPTQRFQNKLASLLKANNMEIPSNVTITQQDSPKQSNEYLAQETIAN